MNIKSKNLKISLIIPHKKHNFIIYICTFLGKIFKKQKIQKKFKKRVDKLRSM